MVFRPAIASDLLCSASRRESPHSRCGTAGFGNAGGSGRKRFPPVQDIVFSGLQFSYATWLGPSGPDGFSEIQANYQVTGCDGYARQGLCHLVPDGTCPYGTWTPAPGNLEFHFAHRIRFLNDDFVHLGAAGLSLGDGAQDDVVQGCIFTDISGNGLDLGGVDAPLAPVDEFTSGNRIEDNLFRNVGAEYRGGIPIVVGIRARHPYSPQPDRSHPLRGDFDRLGRMAG